MLKKKILLPLMVVFALALTGCTTDGGKDVDVDAPEVDVPDVNVGDEIEDVKIKAIEAYDKFIEKYPDAEITKFELDEDMGTYLYKIEAFDSEKEYEVKMDAKTGELLKDNVEQELVEDDDRDEVITKANIEKVDALIEKSVSESEEGSKLDQWELEVEDMMTILEVKVKQGTLDNIEYKYNVETGELVEKDD
nr:PepSY domain-containing protein [Tissierella sp.]